MKRDLVYLDHIREAVAGHEAVRKWVSGVYLDHIREAVAGLLKS